MAVSIILFQRPQILRALFRERNVRWSDSIHLNTEESKYYGGLHFLNRNRQVDQSNCYAHAWCDW